MSRPVSTRRALAARPRGVWRRFVRVCLVCALVVLAAQMSPLTPAVALPPTTAIPSGSSGMGGGGDSNAMALAPSSSLCTGMDNNGNTRRDLLDGGDIWGMHLSTDGGQSWTPHNQGRSDQNDLGVVALAFEVPDDRPVDNNAAYALVGRNTTNPGRLLESKSCGASGWTEIFPGQTGATPYVSSNGQRPREVGHDLVALSRNELLIGATNGLFLVTRTGKTAPWCTGGALCGQVSLLQTQIRGLSVDPSDSTVVYVTYGPGADLIGNQGPSDPVTYGVAALQYHPNAGNLAGAFTQIGDGLRGSAPYQTSDTPHDVVSVAGSFGTDVFVAMGTAGVWHCTLSTIVSQGSSPFSCDATRYGNLGSSLLPGDWVTLAARQDPVKNVPLVVAGCATPYFPANSSCSQTPSSLYYLDEPVGNVGSSTGWTTASDQTNLNQIVGNVTSDPWWMGFATPSMMNGSPGNSVYAAHQLLFDTDASGVGDTSWLFSAGRVGVWRGRLNLQSGAAPTWLWQPASNGLGATEVLAVSADLGGHVAVGDVDWAGTASSTHLGAYPQPVHAAGGGSGFVTTTYAGRMFFGVGAKVPASNPPLFAHVYACDTGPFVSLNGPVSAQCGATDANNHPAPIDLGQVTDGRGAAPERVIGLAVGQAPNQGTNDFTVFAATEYSNNSNAPGSADGGGLWMRQFSGVPSSWQRITALATNNPKAPLTFTSKNHRVSLIWSTKADYLYLYDPYQRILFRSPLLGSASGIWGQSGPWTFDPIWTPPGLQDNPSTGYVVGDRSDLAQPTNPQVLWASTSSGVYRLQLPSGSATTVTSTLLQQNGAHPATGQTQIRE